MWVEPPADALRAEFERRREAHDRLLQEARFALEQRLNQARIEVHDITGRVKAVDSFLDKIRQQECVNPFEEIRDIVGLRVVCLLRRQLAQIIDVARREFEVHEIYDWDAERPAETFGYASTHIYARLGSRCQGPRYDGLHSIIFEIQARTIGMHAWASLSRHVDYKAEHAVPSHLRRQFYALNAMYYMLDTLNEQFWQESQRSKADVEQAVQPDGRGFDMEINFDSLAVYLRLRFPGRQAGDADTMSRLSTELADRSYRHLSEVDRLLKRATSLFAAWEREHPPEGSADGRYTAAGVVRMSLRLVDPG